MDLHLGTSYVAFVTVPSQKISQLLAFKFLLVVMQHISNVNLRKVKHQLGVTQQDVLFVCQERIRRS